MMHLEVCWPPKTICPKFQVKGHLSADPDNNEIQHLLLPPVYFVGPNAKKRSGVMGGANNGGYDDDQGSYIQVPHDHISYRYEVLKVIGKGSFGQVTYVTLAFPSKTQQQH